MVLQNRAQSCTLNPRPYAVSCSDVADWGLGRHGHDLCQSMKHGGQDAIIQALSSNLNSTPPKYLCWTWVPWATNWTKNSKQQSHLLTRTINCWLITNCLSHSVSVLILIALLYPRLNFTKDRYCTFRDCFNVSTPAYTEKKSVLGQEIPHMKVSYKKSEV